jgi:hypothetical protein
MLAFGMQGYFSSNYNKLDFLVTILAIADSVADISLMATNMHCVPMDSKLFTTARLLKLVKFIKLLRGLRLLRVCILRSQMTLML